MRRLPAYVSNALHDACSDCYYKFSDVLKPSPRLFLAPKKIFKDMKQRKTGDTPLWSRGLFHISFLGRWYHQSCLVDKVLFTVASLVHLSNPKIGENVFPSLSGSSVHNFFNIYELWRLTATKYWSCKFNVGGSKTWFCIAVRCCFGLCWSCWVISFTIYIDFSGLWTLSSAQPCFKNDWKNDPDISERCVQESRSRTNVQAMCSK